MLEKILLVEDNPGDVRLTKEMLKEAGFRGTCYVVSNGLEALDFLYQCGDYVDAPRPDIVLLDWYLPKKSGKEVLAELKSDESLARIPVIVLTGCQPELETLQSKSPQAEVYTVKPIEADEFLDIADEFAFGHPIT
ncbi:response regulator [Natronococcus wangiae]|uniref:response regulator n=1 Tax=Natronococcus wangiae TaxID=3068275 RepID=UPI00273FEE19|nr:response regulator [Natronococcus sp. AD5]